MHDHRKGIPYVQHITDRCNCSALFDFMYAEVGARSTTGCSIESMDEPRAGVEQGDPPVTAAFSDRDYQEHADFRCALRTFFRFAEEQARVVGITPQQYVLLVLVRGHRSHPKVTIGELAEALQLRQSSTSLLVDRCVKRGILDRGEDPEDRRRAVVSLTPEGQRILDRVMTANRRKLGSLQDYLFRDSLLAKIREHGTGEDLDAAP